MKRFSSKVRNISVIAVAVMMLVGLMPTTVLAATCEDGEHKPGIFVVKQNYTECGGGYKADAYICSICNDFTSRCDINGNNLTAEAGTGNHAYVTKAADYTDCCGGYKVEHSVCTVCGTDSVGSVGYEEADGVSGIGAQGTNTLTFNCQLVQAKAATAEEDGNIEYFKCKTCGQAIVQGRSIQKVSAADVIIPKLTQDPAPEVKPEEKPETNTPVVTPENSEVKVETTITEVPAGVADKFATVEEIEAELIETAIASNNTFKEETSESVIIDVTLMVDNGAGQMVPVTPENFPAEGVEAVLPYPEGTDKDSFDFVITHMITSGAKAGQVEVLTPDPQADGIHVRFTSMSPVVITYQTKEVTKANADENALAQWIWNNMQAGSKAESATVSTTPTSPKTFDVTGGLMTLTAFCGAVAVVCGKKSKKN